MYLDNLQNPRILLIAKIIGQRSRSQESFCFFCVHNVAVIPADSTYIYLYLASSKA